VVAAAAAGEVAAVAGVVEVATVSAQAALPLTMSELVAAEAAEWVTADGCKVPPSKASEVATVRGKLECTERSS